MMGLEILEDPKARKPFDPKLCIGAQICMRLRKRGILLRPLGDVIIVMPPLAMPANDIIYILEAVKKELNQLL